MLDNTKEQWPPDYKAEIKWRQKELLRLQKDPLRLQAAKEVYKNGVDGCIAFIRDWAWIHEPRDTFSEDAPPLIPFIPFKRQCEFVQFILECLLSRERGLGEKSRDVGVTWLCVWISIWLWLFFPRSAIGWGSQDADDVDQLGNPSSIFEKIRIGIRNLPQEFYPAGFNESKHLSYMRIVNPENGAVIMGGVGDNIGRGGRTLAQPLDAQLLTPSGFQLMADMRIGSIVIGSDGLPTKVVNVIDHGVKSVYRILFSDGTSTECCDDHLWTVTTRGTRKLSKWRETTNTGSKRPDHSKFMKELWEKRKKGKEFITISTHEIRKSIFVNETVEHQYQIPISKAIKLTTRSLPLDGYIVGALLGDGSVGQQRGSPSLACGQTKTPIIEEFDRLLPNWWEIKPVLKDGVICAYRLLDELRPQGRGKYSRTRLAVIVAGIGGMIVYNKFIPEQYKFSDESQRLSVLQGLMDTDGWISKTGKICFGSTSKQLLLDVRWLAQSLGGVASLHETEFDRIEKSNFYTTVLSLPDGLNPFRLSSRVKEKRKYQPRRSIIAVEKIGRKPVRCITVENSDGLYLTNDCIVTHNCTFKDESAHYLHPELVEAALSHNCQVQIDMSSVHGTGNLFHRRREAGVEWHPGAKIEKGRTRVFVFDWRDHPGKTQEWYDLLRAEHERTGTMHILAQEVDRDYSAAMEGVIIPAIHVKAAVDAHIKLKFKDDGHYGAALDIADQGGDLNALVTRRGPILKSAEDWGERDTGATTRRVIAAVKACGQIDVQYDASGGFGSGVKAEANRLAEEHLLPRGIDFIPWLAGGEVHDKDRRVIPGDSKSPTNNDLFQNLKAQAAWALARRFELTYRAINEAGFTYDEEDLISIPSGLPNRFKLEKELSQPVWIQSTKLKLMVDKTPEGSKSPNLFDAAMMVFFPMKSTKLMRFTQGMLDRVRINPRMVGGRRGRWS